MSNRIFEATQSFSIQWEGQRLVVARGATVREGHPLLAEYPQLFGLMKPDFEHTPAPAPAPKKVEAPPPPPPPAKKVAAPAATPGVSTSGKGGGA